MPKPNDQNVEQIFSDKIKLTKTLISFELDMIQEYNSMMRRLKIGEICESDLSQDHDYYSVWQQMFQLYDFIEFDTKRLDKVEKLEWIVRFNRIINKYRDTNDLPNLEDFKFFYLKIRNMMVLCGFHDVSTNKAPMRDFLKPTQKWD